MRNQIWVVLALAIAVPMFAETPTADVVDAWFAGNDISFEQSMPPRAETAKYEYTATPSGDVRIRLSAKGNGEAVDGEMMVVSNVLLIKGIPTEPGYEVDVIDGAMIQVQIVTKLLAYAAKVPPGKVPSDLSVDATEQKYSLHASTTSAEARFPPPWSVKGSLHKVSANEVAFEFVFSFTAEDKSKQALRFVGSWKEPEISPSFPDGLDIREWKLYDFGFLSATTPHGSTLDYGAKTSAQSYASLGELRRAASAAQKQQMGAKP